MASILDRYGIKEVADVTFYEIGADGEPGKPVLFLDTLKVSTIEQTAENTAARGGKGNPELVSWDYGKEITVSIEDALFSPKSMAIMFGDGNIITDASSSVLKTAVLTLTSAGKLPDYFTADIYNTTDSNVKRTKVYVESSSQPHADGVSFADYSSKIIMGGLYSEDGEELDPTVTVSDWGSAAWTARSGQKVLLRYTEAAKTNSITISGDSFPGTYYVTGDTYARSDVTGKDQFFQFVIPKAKMQAENTITLEAEGDPAVFNMSLRVLRPASGEMMKLVPYELQ